MSVKKSKTEYKLVAVFYSYPELSNDNLYNELKIEQMPTKDSFQWIQDKCKGSLEILPHRHGSESEFIAYANESGLMMNLRRNDLAGGTLTYLGFLTMNLPLGCAYSGTVIVLDRNGKSLSSDQIQKIKKAMNDYKRENESETDDESDHSFENRPVKRIKK